MYYKREEKEGDGLKNDHTRASVVENLLLGIPCLMESLSYGVSQYGDGSISVWIYQNGVKFKCKYCLGDDLRKHH